MKIGSVVSSVAKRLARLAKCAVLYIKRKVIRIVLHLAPYVIPFIVTIGANAVSHFLIEWLESLI